MSYERKGAIMGSYNVVVLPGDGVGLEVIREGMKALRAALNLANMDVRFTELEKGLPITTSHYSQINSNVKT
jgi:isocitrate/isopropylmalate dehydrogenase